MNINHQRISFFSDGNKLVGDLYFPPNVKKSPAVLFLHGGKNLINNRFEEWQKILCAAGFVSLSFHFRGVGKSEGKFEDGSLKNRLKDSLNALTFLRSQSIINIDKIAVEGSSMGGHIAARLIQKNPTIKVLILQSAAAYGTQTENKKLNNNFTKEISKKNNWFNSPVFSILKTYCGKVLIIYGERDEVIPSGVMKGYKESIKNGEYIIIKSGGHALLRPKNREEIKARSELFEQSRRFLDKYLNEKS
jgi:hypothetical protein